MYLLGWIEFPIVFLKGSGKLILPHLHAPNMDVNVTVTCEVLSSDQHHITQYRHHIQPIYVTHTSTKRYDYDSKDE